MRALVALAVALACAAPVRAQQPESTGIDSHAVAAFADAFLPREMDRRHIPGLVLVFVSAGEIAIARGYGTAQMEPRRAVDPDRTVFRLASVSKSITATAALQLVERGRLDLQQDVNAYLRSFQVAAAHGPIALHHLLTHTAGFDERLTGISARAAADLQPLSTYLARSMPPTFVEPGRVVSYSNHGFALVGQLVQEIDGRPFAEYVRQEIFEPLGMQRSGTLTGPVPDEFAVAYDYVDGHHRALAADYLQPAPAGAFFTTGADMARFLIAHLRGGAYRDRRILRAETVAAMHAQHFVQTPGTSGWAYGFWEDTRAGHRALLHNGGGKGYRALMYLLPQQDAGFFLAYNLADQHAEGELQEVFISQFRSRFVAAGRPTVGGVEEPQSTESFTGEYVYVRRARTTMEKMIAVLNRVRVIRGGDGGLAITASSGRSIPLTPIGPLLFQRADERGVVAFDALVGNTPGRLVAITDSGFPAVYERVPWIGMIRVQLVGLLGMALAFLYAAVWRPLAAAARGAPITGSDSRRWSVWLAATASALNLVFMICFPLAFLGPVEGGVPEFVYGASALASSLLIIPPVTAMLSIGAAIAALRIWRDARGSHAARVEHMLVACTLLAFVPFALYWHLMAPFF
jgi:CubicO group peptidase (beta-lactamase class C family)